MAKLTKEQIMVGNEMVQRGVSIRGVAQQLGVTEGALRYRLKQHRAGAGPDGRANKPTAVDGYQEAIVAILQRLETNGAVTVPEAEHSHVGRSHGH